MNGQASWSSFVPFAVRGRGKLLTVLFKSMLLGAADAPDEASLAAQRRSNLLCMCEEEYRSYQSSAFVVAPV